MSNPIGWCDEALDLYRQCKAAGVPFWFKGPGSAWDQYSRITCEGEGFEMVTTQAMPS